MIEDKSKRKSNSQNKANQILDMVNLLAVVFFLNRSTIKAWKVDGRSEIFSNN